MLRVLPAEVPEEVPVVPAIVSVPPAIVSVPVPPVPVELNPVVPLPVAVITNSPPELRVNPLVGVKV
jgi:hypothetical protein